MMNGMRLPPDVVVALEKKREKWVAIQQVAEGYLTFATWHMGELEKKTANFVDTLDQALEAQRQQLEEERRYDQLSVTEKMIEKQGRLAAVKAEVAEMDEQGVDKSLDRYKRQQAAAKELQEELYELKWEYQDLSQEGAASHEELIEVQRNETKSLQDLRAELAGLNAERMGMAATAAVTGDPVDVERYNSVLEEMIALAKQVNSQIEENRKKMRAALEESADAYEDLLDAQNTEEENLKTLKASLAGVNAERMAMIANMVMSGDPANADGINAVSALLSEQADLLREITKLEDDRAEAMARAQKDSAEAYRELLELQYEDKRSLQDLRAEMAGLNAQRMGMIATAVVNGGAFSAEELEAITAIMKEQARVLDLINEKEEENQRQVRETADEAARA